MSQAAPTDFDRIGGEARLRPLIAEFTRRVFSDVMIGFLFDGKPHKRITEMEYRFAAQHLGADLAYNGRTMAEAHRASPILGGHFARRRQILANTLRDFDVDPDIIDRWLAHVDSLADQILGAGVDPRGCDDAALAERLKGRPAPQPQASRLRRNLLDEL